MNYVNEGMRKVKKIRRSTNFFFVCSSELLTILRIVEKIQFCRHSVQYVSFFSPPQQMQSPVSPAGSPKKVAYATAASLTDMHSDLKAEVKSLKIQVSQLISLVTDIGTKLQKSQALENNEVTCCCQFALTY